jgi:hypothetical protein
MDKVRFGKALGTGARHAARSLWNAAEAAAAPDPRAQAGNSAAREASAARPQVFTPRAAQSPLSSARNTAQRGAGIAQQAAGAARHGVGTALKPVAKFSSVLWKQVTGSFFALFALIMAQGVWRLRGSAAGSVERQHLYVYALLAVLFSYFAASSFHRAWRRGRRT